MYAQVEKPEENKTVAKKKGNLNQRFGLVDTRPQATMQRKLRERINNSKGVTQLLRADARHYIRTNHLEVEDRLESVQEYVWDSSKPGIHRTGLLAAWNQNQRGRFVISKNRPSPPEITPELIAALLVIINSQPNQEVLDDIEDGSIVLPTEFSHFKFGKAKKLLFNKVGKLMNPDEKEVASKRKRLDTYRKLGIGEHVEKGHFMDEKTLISQAKNGKPNFAFSNELAFLSIVEMGRRKLALSSSKFTEFDAPPDMGYGFLIGTDRKLYKVVPKRYRVVAKQKGDFKTSYGVTEEKNPDNFASAYYSYDEV
ncbi:hypothetical protein OAT18_03950 [Tenacibaculum sp.]|nr:hypothetical protein [Tenacibaculum sp.]